MSSTPASLPLPPHSENVDEELRRVILALQSVFSPSNPPPPIPSTSPEIDPILSRRETADRYLTSFQRCPVSWMVCDRLLILSNDTSPSAAQRRFFAAQTLHFKCREEVFVRQIPGDSLPSLRDSLVRNLSNYALAGGNRPLVTRLCMAISSLAVQMRWTSVIPDVLESIYRPRPELAPAVLELFQLLPEECTSDRLFVSEESKKYEMRESFRNCSESILGFLSHCYESSGNTTVQTGNNGQQMEVMLCLTSWLRHVDIPPQLLESSVLLERAFEVVGMCGESRGEDVFESAVDLIVEALRMYGSAPTANAGLVRKIIPLVMGLGRESFQKARMDEDEDTLRGYCRIFTEMGESYMQLIMAKEEMNQSALVELVLRCCEIPDNEIANITLNFWYHFVNSLETLEPYSFRQQRIDYYTPLLTRLLQICTVLMRYPPDIHELQPDRFDDIYRDRFYVSETVEDCCRLLGGDVVLSNLGARLQEEYQTFASGNNTNNKENWQGIESCLFAMKSIAKYIPNDEGTYLPHIMGLISHRALPQDAPLLRCTANLTVGSYAAWLGTHPSYLEQLMTYLAEGLSVRDSAPASAIAIKQLCESCWNQPLSDPVLQLYDNIVQSREDSSNTFMTDLKDELEVLEGVCKAISSQYDSNISPATMASTCLERIVQPIGNRLSTLIAPDNTTSNSKQVISEIERLTVIVRFLTLPPSDPNQTGNMLVFELMKQSWNLLDAVTLKFPTDTNLAEKVCRLHKHALRKCGAECYDPLLDPLMNQIVRNFCQSHQSPYLYLASICITEYGRQKTYIEKLFQMISQLSTAVFGFLKTLQDFTSHPDVVEEFFYLVGRFMSYCPEPLVLSPLLQSLLQCAAVGMHVQHRDANKGTLNFLEHTMSFGIDLISDEQRRHYMRSNSNTSTSQESSDQEDETPNEPEQILRKKQQRTLCQQSLQNAILAEGQTIVTNLARALLGELPAYSLDSGSGSLAGVLWKLNALCPELLLQWITEPLKWAPNCPAKMEFLDCLAKRMARDELNVAVRRFNSVCERSRKLQENGGT